MLGLSLPDGPLTILCLGAHPDDIEIGCGGSLLRLLDEHPGSSVWWVVLGATDRRAQEAEAGAQAFAGRAAGLRIMVHQFRDGHFPSLLTEIKEAFESLREEVPSPDLILTHYRDDRHQDHRVVSELTWQTFRNHAIMEFEIPKYDGDLGSPNLFIPLTEPYRRRKLDALLQAFPSQREKHWFTEDTFLALMRLRGVECASPEGYAEAFHMRKVLLRRD